jgi:hypothetical protein
MLQCFHSNKFDFLLLHSFLVSLSACGFAAKIDKTGATELQTLYFMLALLLI